MTATFYVKSCSTFIGIILLLSCAPKPKETPVLLPASPPPVPFELRAEAANGRAIIHWRIDRPANIATSGYYIYLAESKDDSGKLYNNTPYPGDTDGDITRESITIEGLTDGRVYHAYIVTVMADGRLSRQSEKIRFMPIEMGELKISFDILSDSSGYSFAKKIYTKARDYDNDFYLFYKNGPNISSPSLYNTGLRKTLFAAGSNLPIEQAIFYTSLPFLVNREIMLKTADKTIVMLKLLNLNGGRRPTGAILKYAFHYADENQ
jgi:hypothetical protein